MEYNLAIKKNEILSFVTTWIDLESTLLSGVSQVRKTAPYDLSRYVGPKKKQMSKTEQKQTHRHREQSELPEGRRVGGDG